MAYHKNSWGDLAHVTNDFMIQIQILLELFML